MRGEGVLTPFAEKALGAARSILALGKRIRVESSSESSATEEEESDDEEEREEAVMTMAREEDSVDPRMWSA